MCCLFSNAQSQTIIFNSDHHAPVPIGKGIEILEDRDNVYNASNIIATGKFEKSKEEAPVYTGAYNNIWGRFSVLNQSADTNLVLNIEYPHIKEIVIYKLSSSGILQRFYESGTNRPFSQKESPSINFRFNLKLPSNQTGVYYFNIRSPHPVELRMHFSSMTKAADIHAFQAIIMALYIGIFSAILLYNLFLFISTLDRSYLVYVAYLFFLSIAQLTFAGWSYKFIWPNYPALNDYGVIWTSGLAGITGIYFAIYFLHTRNFLPKGHRFLLAYIAIYASAILISFTSFRSISYLILNVMAVLAGVSLLILSALIGRKGYRPAVYYFIAWSAFLIGLVIFVLRNFGVLPTNNFTLYVLFGGSAIEAILLSIALADKINILTKEKEESQAQALEVSLENEKLVREQNIVLEAKVNERTEELQAANEELSDAYKTLKDAQIQLVEAEKMASLGQLTAGIAHEINNPINFVKSNIKPLTLDINDLVEVIDEYQKLHEIEQPEIAKQLELIDRLRTDLDVDFLKTEIFNLLKGIEDGAERTAEIVRGLRTFSRLDESMIKIANVHEGIESTLILLRSSIPEKIKVIRDFNAEGNIECYPGKLNQVFMNILSNAVHAIKTKPYTGKDEFIVISTRDILDDQIEICIRDSGGGIPQHVKQKIFDPFFTTKDVGEGTGLGLAIVFKIIKEHTGKIVVNSTEGEGAEFIVTLSHSLVNSNTQIIAR
jgi:signal transduction histidine kinase